MIGFSYSFSKNNGKIQYAVTHFIFPAAMIIHVFEIIIILCYAKNYLRGCPIDKSYIQAL